MMSQQLGFKNTVADHMFSFAEVTVSSFHFSASVPVLVLVGGHLKMMGRWHFAQGCSWAVSVHTEKVFWLVLCMETFSLLSLELSAFWWATQQVLIDLISGFFKVLVTKACSWHAQTPDSLLEGELKAEKGVRAELPILLLLLLCNLKHENCEARRKANKWNLL